MATSSYSMSAQFPGVTETPNTTSRDRGFAICLSITPGLPAASLGYPVRGGANFGVAMLGSLLITGGSLNSADVLTAMGVVALIGSYVWSAVDAFRLPMRNNIHRPPDLENDEVEDADNERLETPDAPPEQVDPPGA